jgi:hypothetical protein
MSWLFMYSSGTFFILSIPIYIRISSVLYIILNRK